MDSTKASLKLAHGEISGEIIGACYDVYNTFGYGLPEALYRESVAIAVEDRGLRVRQEVPLDVHFRGRLVGHYRADLIVNDCFIVEIKSVDKLAPVHDAQVYTYLKIARLRVGLLFNFGPRPSARRLFLPADRVLPF